MNYFIYIAFMKNNIKNCGIYEIINIFNNKRYVGSSKNLYQRHQKHFSMLRHKKHDNCYLQNSWNKYGENNFEFNIIEYCKETDLRVREQYYIDNLNSEYNITREVIRNTLSLESRLKHSATKKRMFASGELTPTKMRDVYQYNLNGEFVKKWNCITTACLHVGIVRSTIHRCLCGKYRTAGGFMWSYEYLGIKINKSLYKKQTHMLVHLYKLTNIHDNTELILTMDGIEKQFNTTRNSVRQYIVKNLNFKKQYKIIKLNDKVKKDLIKLDELPGNS